MKKIIALLIAAMMTVSFAACGNETKGTESSNTASESSEIESSGDSSKTAEKEDSKDESSDISKEESSDGKVSADFKETMDNYETFFNDYIEFMEKYQKSDDTTAMLADYTEFMKKYNDMTEKLETIDEEDLSAEDALYYAEVSARISEKLSKLAQ